MRLWGDVPQNERVDREFIESCGGANPETWKDAKDPGKAAADWVERKLSTLDRTDVCSAGIKWGSSRRWKRCTQRVAPGDKFCFRHGGAHPPKPVHVKKSSDPQWVTDRLERRRERLMKQRSEIDEALSKIDQLLRVEATKS